jgi:hypothetical protein
VVGENVPHPAEPQLHVTPALFTSLVTVAFRLAVPDVATENAAGNTDTAMGRIVICGAFATLLLSATEVAVIVTAPPWGTDVGAV